MNQPIYKSTNRYAIKVGEHSPFKIYIYMYIYIDLPASYEARNSKHRFETVGLRTKVKKTTWRRKVFKALS